MPLDPDILRSEDLRRWQQLFPDATPIAQLQPRQRAVCVGVVQKIRLDPGHCLEVTVEDGSGRLTAVFSGRMRVTGLDLGAGLRLEGTTIEHERGLQMRNPSWEHVTEPYG